MRIIHGNVEILSEFSKSRVRIIHVGVLYTETYSRLTTGESQNRLKTGEKRLKTGNHNIH